VGNCAPTAEWISHQLTRPIGWKVSAFGRWAFGIGQPRRDRRGRTDIVKRAIGSIRRNVLTHVVVFGDGISRHLLRSYATYYNEARTHLSVTRRAAPRYSTSVVALSLRHLADFSLLRANDFRTGTGLNGLAGTRLRSAIVTPLSRGSSAEPGRNKGVSPDEREEDEAR